MLVEKSCQGRELWFLACRAPEKRWYIMKNDVASRATTKNDFSMKIGDDEKVVIRERDGERFFTAPAHINPGRPEY
jgi:hypothetical protein